MRLLLSDKGFSFVEVICVLVILGVAFPSLMNLFSETTQSAANVNAIPVGSALGKDLMEDVMARKFDELDTTDANGNWSTTLATDAGETAADKDTFDDVDDFNGWNQEFGANYPGFSADVDVDYVDPADLNTPLAIPGPTPNDWTPSYKRIVVTISNDDSLPNDLNFITIVTDVQSL